MKTWMALALFCYFLAMLKFFIHLAVRRWLFFALGTAFTALGFLFHTFMLFAISAQTGHGPYTNAFEFASFFSWTTIGALLAVIIFVRATVMGAFMAPLGFLLLAYSMLLPNTPLAEGTQMKAFWLTMHFTMSFLALSSFIVVFSSSVMYLVQERQLKHHLFGAVFKRMPDLDTLDLMMHRALLFGFPLISVGAVSGIIWTSSKFGTPFGPQPLKALPVLLVWLVFAVLMFGRVIAGWRGHKIAVLGTIGFALAMAGLGIHLL